MKYEKPEVMVISDAELENMIIANASGCGFICMVTNR